MSHQNSNKSNLIVAILTKGDDPLLDQVVARATRIGTVVLLVNSATYLLEDKNSLDACERIDVSNLEGFAAKRNAVLKSWRTDWLLYLDADELLTDELIAAILQHCQADTTNTGMVIRQNYFLGRQMYDDQVERLFHQSTFTGYEGILHESPQYQGHTVKLSGKLEHHTHRDISSMLEKTNDWTEHEAALLKQAGHPPVYWWRLPRIMISTAWEQIVGKKLYRYGREGWYEAIFQVINGLIRYVKLYELQQTSK